nr:josephin-2-like [Lytechinus pictus]
MPIYHEKQRWELCALHALNNVFQDAKAFNKQSMDELCQSLSPGTVLNPHKSMLGLGNYDVNVIMAAVQRRECEAVWWDKRRSLEQLELDNILGFIMNVPSPIQLGFVSVPIRRKHWIALRHIEGAFYNLDSKLGKPQTIGATPAIFLDFLRSQLKQKGCELLLIVERDVCELRTWLHEPSS